ncbi:MAG: dihydrodipicolinate synthase family protein [Oscillospiraceae bacterium]|nr:dihydrodipicolinate synthase family protein [Oscillospiraceae bacterium]
MKQELNKYRGIFPAFYACYDEAGAVSPESVRALTEYLIGKGVQGLYVGGSSGECIYQSVAERKLVLENVMAVARGKLVIIAHVACNNTADSMELAAHAESLGVDAIAAIPPIYFHLPDRAMARYWNDISSAAPNTDFVIYNIPQLAGVALNSSLLRTMLKNPKVIGVKNSSMPVQDIEMWRDEGAIVFNGPDEQLLSGLVAGAIGGIGGTYGAMPELYLKIYELVQAGKIAEAREIQDACCQIIYKMCSGQGNMYGIIKAIIRELGGPDAGGVRAPLYPLQEEDYPIARETAKEVAGLIAKFC